MPAIVYGTLILTPSQNGLPVIVLVVIAVVVAAAVVNDHIGPVVVVIPSLTVTYHSYSAVWARDGQVMLVVDPDSTPVFVPINSKLAVADMVYGSTIGAL